MKGKKKRVQHFRLLLAKCFKITGFLDFSLQHWLLILSDFMKFISAAAFWTATFPDWDNRKHSCQLSCPFQGAEMKPSAVCCVYLGHSLFTVHCVLGPRLVGGAPVEVELSCQVAMGQARQVHGGGQRQLHWRPGERRRCRTHRDTAAVIPLLIRLRCQRLALR